MDINEPECLIPGKTFLVIDSKEETSVSIRSILSSVGYNVDIATDIYQAAEDLIQKNYSIIFINPHAFEMSTAAMLNYIRSQPFSEKTTVVALSEDNRPGNRNRLIQCGFDDYLSVPYEPRDLIQLIQNNIKGILKSHILLVEDNSVNEKITKKILEPMFHVSCTKSAADTWEFLENNSTDLILLDIQITAMKDFKLLKCLKADKRYASIPVVCITSDLEHDKEILCLKAGAFDFIINPFSSNAMVQRISRILNMSQMQDNLKDEVVIRTRQADERKSMFETLTIQVMHALAKTIDAKDRYTNGHSIRVAEYSMELAKHLEVTEKEQKEIYYMALLHDIGKIGIPDKIINKPSHLTNEEYSVIKTHPIIGANILQNISAMPSIVKGARWHHERYDGKGYPDQLRGEEIPMVARIIGVADAYDAMTSVRSYRKALPQDVVRSEIEKGSGTQFDPVIAKVMLDMIDHDKNYVMKTVEA